MAPTGALRSRGSGRVQVIAVQPTARRCLSMQPSTLQEVSTERERAA